MTGAFRVHCCFSRSSGVYDNSHIQGSNAVGAMIVASEESFSKKHYRTFNIKSKTLTPGDDFGMMREVLTRRFTRLADESELDAEDVATGMPDWPDVVFIGGGLSQLNAVNEVVSQMNLPREVIFIGIAKGEERDAGRGKSFVRGKDAFMLPARDPVLNYVQRLRDEVHRFAIGTHRARRARSMVRNPLDEIEGIGPTPQTRPLAPFRLGKGGRPCRPRRSFHRARGFPKPSRGRSTTTSIRRDEVIGMHDADQDRVGGDSAPEVV